MNENRLPRLLKEILVYRNPGAIEKVADSLGETYDYIWSQTHGRVNPHIKVLRAAFLATKDPRLKRELEPDGFELVRERTAKALKAPEAESTDIVLQVSNLIDQLRKALSDGTITPQESDGLEKQFCEIEKELIEARVAVRDAAASKKVQPIK